ncbi:MAG: SDR family oxidoreductase [Rhodobacteraceae bacterium]|nr:SDR family oxidoreductase [Paracoccaceae bacterium]
MIAVTGANGQLGRLVLAALQEKGATAIRALVRSPEKGADLANDKVSVVEADYDRPETLAAALAGVDRLILISSSEVGKRAPQHQAVIDAAKTAGVKQIAYTSILSADSSEMALAAEHKVTEEALAASGIAHVLLRNSWYIENYDSSVGAGLQFGAIAGAAGEGKISAASRKDYAEAAAVVALSDDLSTRTYELGASTAFTMADLAAAVSKESGKTIPYTNLSKQDYVAMLVGAGIPDGFAQILADSDTCAAKGSLYTASNDLETLIGHKTLSLEDYVAKTVAG